MPVKEIEPSCNGRFGSREIQWKMKDREIYPETWLDEDLLCKLCFPNAEVPDNLDSYVVGSGRKNKSLTLHKLSNV